MAADFQALLSVQCMDNAGLTGTCSPLAGKLIPFPPTAVNIHVLSFFACLTSNLMPIKCPQSDIISFTAQGQSHIKHSLVTAPNPRESQSPWGLPQSHLCHQVRGTQNALQAAFEM